MSNLALQPRIIRAGDVMDYCGMSRLIFKEHIKPNLTRIQIGVQGVGYDRFEIDRVLDDYIARYGRAPAVKEENDTCENIKSPVVVSSTGMVSGISTKPSTEADFAGVVARVTKLKPKGS